MNDKVLCLEGVELYFPRKEGPLSTLKRLLMKPFGGRAVGPQTCGLSGINLTIEKGEIIGIIGRNGSGKSTLLRTIAGIYKPDSGWIGIAGQTSLLAGVGVGMNKDLTGRENIHLYGSMLGHEQQHMESMMSEIIQFSELEEFIDEPLRTYSSGMKARLGISVATAVKPDILLIDEVLGVGDPGFKKRSQQRIRDMMDDSNTVILVSHSFSLLKDICSRMIMMEKGKMKIVGTPDEVIAAYHEAEG